MSSAGHVPSQQPQHPCLVVTRWHCHCIVPARCASAAGCRTTERVQRLTPAVILAARTGHHAVQPCSCNMLSPQRSLNVRQTQRPAQPCTTDSGVKQTLKHLRVAAA
jgi:hypothetical protein